MSESTEEKQNVTKAVKWLKMAADQGGSAGIKANFYLQKYYKESGLRPPPMLSLKQIMGVLFT